MDPLFPYTTLFRSRAGADGRHGDGWAAASLGRLCSGGLAASMDGRWRGNAMKRSWLKPISVGAVLLLAPAPAHAVAGIATTVLSDLTALVAPAIALGVIWLGVLIISGRAAPLSFPLFQN